MEPKLKKIGLDVEEDRLAADLQKYQEKAIELGATRAKIVRTDEIPVDERVTMKCQIPICFGYGVGANCPPHREVPVGRFLCPGDSCRRRRPGQGHDQRESRRVSGRLQDRERH
jgi:hypothetical protein